jgi:hypothetical protein
MCTYCRVLDHSTEDYPQLVVKWQAKGNQNSNLNLNLQMISTERCNEGPRVVAITRGGSRTGTDKTIEGKQMEQWVRKSAGPIPTFDPQQEKETYQRERKEIIGMDWGTLTSVAPHEEDRAMLENPTGKVSTLT